VVLANNCPIRARLRLRCKLPHAQRLRRPLLTPFQSINSNYPVLDGPALFFSVAFPHHNGGSD
jgi:hypothetical protein